MLNTVRLSGKIDVLGLIDTFNNSSIWGKEIDGCKVLGVIETLRDYPPEENLRVICAIADIDVKRETVSYLKLRGYSFCNIIHPSSIIADNVSLGEGMLINAGTIIETGARVGDHVVIHAGCVVEHDNILEDFVNLGPKVATAGRVHVRSGAIVYTGASIIPDIVIGENAVIGAGAVVVCDVKPGEKVAGVPAKPLL